jgi:AMMECR1 domain-containing protein
VLATAGLPRMARCRCAGCAGIIAACWTRRSRACAASPASSSAGGRHPRFSPVAQEKLEMLDLDHSMRTDIECTKSTMMELRDYCIDIGRMFEQLGYDSAG